MYKIIKSLSYKVKIYKIIKTHKKRFSLYSSLKKIYPQSSYYKQNENFAVLIISLTHKIYEVRTFTLKHDHFA